MTLTRSMLTFLEYLSSLNILYRSNVSLRKKNALRFANVSDISTKLTPLCLPSSLPSCEPSYTTLVFVLLDLAYLDMLFIFQWTICIS